MSHVNGVPEQFSGFAAHDEKAGKALDVKPYKYTPQKWHEGLVDIKITHCRTRGPAPTHYPAICGHEIVGTVVRAGKESGHTTGTRVGVGAQSGSCGSCESCKEGLETFCQKGMIGTYQGKWEDGSVAQGGYADYANSRSKSPRSFPRDCGPDDSGGAGPGKKVAIVGIGGLGHLGVQWAKALGADVYAISHSDSKKEDAEKLGIQKDHFIITTDKDATIKKWGNTFDLIVCTSNQRELPVDTLFFPLLKAQGRLTILALPEEKIRLSMDTHWWSRESALAKLDWPPAMIKEMLDVAVKHNVKAWTSSHPMNEVGQKLKDMDDGKASLGSISFLSVCGHPAYMNGG
ncbi:hypothetical protein PCANC_26719 [Puccinia coronata f. sp. avenae]|uniref:Enoyl reductase (ER) domain-containing protein n=1 Tax=Puccinia coronata f. sp. avenae TaxID=200324 RepID=A0A2N5THK1_9BASI|nr:hypothetical protein PCANC_26719 [Puccinia coronata f. sp. avenae]